MEKFLEIFLIEVFIALLIIGLIFFVKFIYDWVIEKKERRKRKKKVYSRYIVAYIQREGAGGLYELDENWDNFFQDDIEEKLTFPKPGQLTLKELEKLLNSLVEEKILKKMGINGFCLGEKYWNGL